MLSYRLLFALSSIVTIACAANSWIVPGATWMSTSNTKIDAHGGMVLKNGDTFYWIGYAVSHGAVA
jgi:hypothetical protein